MQFETINGLIPFELKGDQGKFEDAYMPYFLEKGLSEKDARDVVSSIWLFANDQWYKGKEYGEHNSVSGEFVELEDNYVPDVVADPYRRKHIRHRFNIKQGQTREQVQAALEQYIKEQIEKNTVYRTYPLTVDECLPPEPAVLPSIQKPKEDMDNGELFLELNSCPNIDTLKTYWMFVKGKPALENKYHDVYNKLQPIQ